MKTRILLTGVGGPAAISFMKGVSSMDVDIFTGDMDHHAAGLYMVAPNRRVILKPGTHPDFVGDLLSTCIEHKIDVLVPTVDAELGTIAQHRSTFEGHGIRLLLADLSTLETCLDKFELFQNCRHEVPMPRTAIYDANTDLSDWSFPCIVKPRSGSGSRDIHVVEGEDDLKGVSTDGDMIIQSFLPGPEYSVDVLCDQDGEVFGVVPRERLKIDSGVAIASRTVRDPVLIGLATTVAKSIGLKFVANIQFRCAENGRPHLLEVNARFPGTMPLTVRAGINMPALSLLNLLGEPISSAPLDFKDTSVVRYLQEVFMDGDVFANQADDKTHVDGAPVANVMPACPETVEAQHPQQHLVLKATGPNDNLELSNKQTAQEHVA